MVLLDERLLSLSQRIVRFLVGAGGLRHTAEQNSGFIKIYFEVVFVEWLLEGFGFREEAPE